LTRRRWLLFLFVLACPATLASCGALLETDQARLCRMALPAIEDADATIRILKQTPFADGRGLRVDYLAGAPGEKLATHFAECRFLAPGRPRKSQDLTSLVTDRGELGEYQLTNLIRFWLATPEARAADPSPLAGAESAWEAPKALAYGLQQALNGLPLLAIYALLAAAYSLV
jgi:branched-chain amino acid transport system permease protein